MATLAARPTGSLPVVGRWYPTRKRRRCSSAKHNPGTIRAAVFVKRNLKTFDIAPFLQELTNNLIEGSSLVGAGNSFRPRPRLRDTARVTRDGTCNELAGNTRSRTEEEMLM